MKERIMFAYADSLLSLLSLLLFITSVVGLPTIVEHPVKGYGAKGSPYTIRCKATPSVPNAEVSVSWYRNGHRLDSQYDNPSSELSIINGGDLFILDFQSSDAGVYYCNASDSSGWVLSKNATLAVSRLSSEFRRVPEDTDAIAGRPVTLYCQSPRGTPNPKISWFKSGINEYLDTSKESRYRLENPGNLVIRDVVKADEGEYWCQARNEAGEEKTPKVQLTVLEVPFITENQINFNVKQGEDAVFKCVAIGDPDPKITWYKNGDMLDTLRTNVRSDNSLVIRDVVPEDEGVYVCLAENKAGSARVQTYLSVNTSPKFLQSPVSKTIGTGRSVQFRCVVSGSPIPTVYWQGPPESALLVYTRQSKGRFSVDEQGTLKIDDVEVNDSGQYRCVAMSQAGVNTSSARLLVRDVVDSLPAPVITKSPVNVTVHLNQDAELQCKATGNPTPTIRWSHNGRPVPVDSRISILLGGNLKIIDVMVTDSGEYTCSAISESGDVSASAILNVVGVKNSAVETLIPAPPGKPVPGPRDIGDTSVKMFWEASGDHSNVLHYTVEAFSKQSRDGWTIEVPNTGNTWALIDNLSPGSQYVFLVRATNNHGTSEASPLSEYVKTTGGDTNPSNNGWLDEDITSNFDKFQMQLNSVDVLSSTSINITWVVDYRYRRYIEGFFLRLSSQFTSGPITKTIHGSYSIYHIWDNLQPYTFYHVQITPFYHSFSGRQSRMVSVRTQEDVPSGPPSKVSVTEGKRYITVGWGIPKPSHRNGKIIGYLIVCRADDWRLSRNISVNASVTTIALDNLNRATSYNIGVAARTHVGAGIISHMTSIPAIAVDDTGEPLWLKPVIIGILGGVLFVILLVLIICMYRRRKANRKAQKANEKGMVTVALPTSNNPPLFVQYQLDNTSNCQHTLTQQSHSSGGSRHPPSGAHGISPLARNILDHDHNPDNYDAGNPNNAKAFYNKSENIGPYATTFILNHMPERDESLIPQESPHATTMRDGNVQGSSESSYTDNNRAHSNGSVGEQGDNSRNSPPSLPSFTELLPPPPLYPPPPYPPPPSVPRVNEGALQSQASPLLHHQNVNLPGSHCHTCHRGFHTPQIHHREMDLQGRSYLPTMPHLSYNEQQQLRNGDYQPTTYNSRGDSAHPYQMYQPCSSHGHSSDSHDYAEPQFDCRDQHMYGMAPVAHQVLPPPHMLHPCSHHTMQHAPTEPLLQQHQSPSLAMKSRHHSIPSSEHSQDLCTSCAECTATEYEEPWSDHPWPVNLNPQQIQELQQRYNQQQTAKIHLQNHDEEGLVVSSLDDKGNATGQSQSGSEDSKSGRTKQKRRQRAQQCGQRPTSPYNGYSTDSSFVYQPRKPYPKSERKKQMSKNKTTKSLAVQVEQDEIQQDKV